MGRILKGPAKEALANKYAKLIASGTDELDAWRQCFPARAKKLAEQSVYNAHSTWRNDPIVMKAVHAATANINVGELDNPAMHHMRVLEARRKAYADKNWTAVAAMDRLVTSHLGMGKDNLSINDERILPDSELLRRIAKLTGQEQSALEPLIAPNGFDKPTDETKH